MAHPRTLLREAVVAQLTDATAAGSRVYDTQIDPHRKGSLPAISVYTLSEPVEPDAANTAPRELTRVPNVEIAGWVSGGDGSAVARAMDNLAGEIEAAMDADRYFAGTAGESVLEGTEMEIRAENGRSDPLIGIVVLTYSVTYRTIPAVALDDFLRVKATHRVVGGVSDTVPASDEFTVQEAP